MTVIKVAASIAILALLASPARSAPACDDLQKYLIGRDQPYASNRGERVEEGQFTWKARTPIPGGDCTIAYWETPRGFNITCSFDKGAASAVMQSSYQSLRGVVQDCLNGLDSRDDWRKRETSNTDSYDGRVVTQTTWTWTSIRNQLERKVVVSSNSGGDAPAENIMEVSWQGRQGGQ
jgi:hypothetical protein